MVIIDDLNRFKVMIEKNSTLLNTLDAEGKTLLHIAAQSNSRKIVKYLLKNHAQLIDIEALDEMNRTPLHTAALEGFLPLCYRFLQHRAYPLIPDANGFQCIHSLSKNLHGYQSKELALLRVVSIILHKILDLRYSIDIPTGDGQTCLHLAVKSPHTFLTKFLLANSANPNIKDNYGRTPLDIAKENKRDEQILILQHADEYTWNCAQFNKQILLSKIKSTKMVRVDHPYSVTAIKDCIGYKSKYDDAKIYIKNGEHLLVTEEERDSKSQEIMKLFVSRETVNKNERGWVKSCDVTLASAYKMVPSDISSLSNTNRRLSKLGSPQVAAISQSTEHFDFSSLNTGSDLMAISRVPKGKNTQKKMGNKVKSIRDLKAPLQSLITRKKKGQGDLSESPRNDVPFPEAQKFRARSGGNIPSDVKSEIVSYTIKEAQSLHESYQDLDPIFSTQNDGKVLSVGMKEAIGSLEAVASSLSSSVDSKTLQRNVNQIKHSTAMLYSMMSRILHHEDFLRAEFEKVRNHNLIIVQSLARGFIARKKYHALKIKNLLPKRRLLELLKTEIDYIRDMKDLSEKFLKPLKGKQIISSEELAQLAPQWEILVSFHESFLKQFVDYQKKKNFFNSEISLGKIFEDNFHYMKVYGSYFDEFDGNFCRSLSDKYPAFQAEVAAFQTKHPHFLSVSDVLIKPAQRMLKYPLILGDLVRETSEENVEYDRLVKAHRTIVQLSDDLNKRKKLSEDRSAVFRLTRSLSKLNINLVEANRIYIQDIQVNFWNKDQVIPMTLFLLNDILIFAVKKDSIKKGLESLRRGVSGMVANTDIKESDIHTHEFINLFNLEKISVFIIPNTPGILTVRGIENGFQLVIAPASSRARSLTFTCATAEERDRFLTALINQIVVYHNSTTAGAIGDETKPVKKEGWLQMRSARNWKKKFLRLQGSTIFYLDSEQGRENAGTFRVSPSTILIKYGSSSLNSSSGNILTKKNGDEMMWTLQHTGDEAKD
eukprot:TRINITY_DN4832_c0_g1_i1.p1 TRINITY_DN4832_c0_g1~~TRINITY_DN4832_c0_g1_i1.p1  ORF type:complete len:1046 (+),score=322.33 TRINITY_DN4832_c0_g1_i1:155-3139(+)